MATVGYCGKCLSFGSVRFGWVRFVLVLVLVLVFVFVFGSALHSASFLILLMPLGRWKRRHQNGCAAAQTLFRRCDAAEGLKTVLRPRTVV